MNATIDALKLSADLAQLDEADLQRINARYAWLLSARPDQLPPEDYLYWMLLGGRGAGKTRSGAEEIWWQASHSGRPERIAVVGPTNDDVRKTCFEGESGLLAVIPPSLVLNWNRSALEMWLTNGSYFVGYSAEKPERLRGPQHHRAWCDELGAWNNPQYCWDMMSFGLRLGPQPSVVITTTPKPTPLIRELVADPDTVLARASTMANKQHLPEKLLNKWLKRYGGTRLGRQELAAELLDDLPGALWQRGWFDANRFIPPRPNMTPKEILALLPPMRRLVVAVDPSGAADEADEDADEIGIVVAGLGADDNGYLLQDASMRGSPKEWAEQAVWCWKDWGADKIVAEINYGGAMVEYTIKVENPNVPVTVIHASRGKVVRAQPVSSLYEQGRVRHVGNHSLLEDQMCLMGPDGYTGAGSPDRVDGAVWALTDIMVEPDVPLHVSPGVLKRARQLGAAPMRGRARL